LRVKVPMNHVYLFSDATGETVERVARAALTQFKDVDVRLHKFGQIRTIEDILRALDEVSAEPGIIFYTLVNSELAQFMRSETEARQLDAVDMITPLLFKLAEFLEKRPQKLPGLQYEMNSEYYRRMEAVDFTVKQDDGQEPRNLHKADIVLVGVSRSSKTPLSMYLAHKGYKVANVPIIQGIEPPVELEQVEPGRVVGLIINTQRLVDIRSARLRNLRQSPRGSYADYRQVEEELAYCRRYYRSHPCWLVIDVTNKSVEESAAEIVSRLHGELRHD
jgi:[pyruvate, water dikinase]-phosphate phosphotransferase / [pyruvate, water dikinase] kinase